MHGSVRMRVCGSDSARRAARGRRGGGSGEVVVKMKGRGVELTTVVVVPVPAIPAAWKNEDTTCRPRPGTYLLMACPW